MKTSLLRTIAFLILALAVNTVKAQDIYANQLVSSTSDVQNPQYITDTSPGNYASITNLLTLLSTTSVTVDFPQGGKAGDVVNIVVQGTGQVLGVNLLNNTTFELYQNNTLVKTVSGSTALSLGLLDPNGNIYRIKAPTDIADNYTFNRVKVSFSNLLSVNLLNSFRIYSVFFQQSCPPTYATSVYSNSSGGVLMPYVINASHAVSASTADSAVIGLPLGLIGLLRAHLDLSFTDVGRGGDFVGFTISEGSTLLNLNVLNNISMYAYNSNGDVVATKAGFNLLDLKLLAGSSNRYTIGFQTNPGTYNIKRVRIEYGGVVNVLGNLNVFNAFHFAIDRPNITVALSGDNVLCPGETVTLTAFDSLGATNYVWNNNATGSTLVVSQPGIYSVTVMDGLGCTRFSIPIEIFSAPNPSVQIVGDTLFCENTTGTLSTSSPFVNYLWSNNSNSSSINITGVGQYFVTVTDSNGCQGSDSVQVAKQNLTVLPIITNATCATGADGAIALNISGGSGNYNYSWSNGATTPGINNLSPGMYSVNITDAAAACTNQFSFTVSALNNLSLQTSIVNTTKCGASDGKISVVPVGGSGNYDFNWSNSATTSTNDQLQAGWYGVVVTDITTGCSISDTLIVNDGGSGIQITPTVTAATSCATANGAILLSVTGGTAPYNYNWSNGSSTASLLGLGAGVYFVTVTDALGCSNVLSIEVGMQASLDISAQITASNCLSKTGSINTSILNGSGIYTYQWSNGQNTANLSNVGAGTYEVVVTDNVLGCAGSAIFVVSELGGAQATVNVTQPACNNNQGGAVSLTVPAGAYKFNWSNGAVTQNISGLGAGTYTVTITDTISGCSSVYKAVITAKKQIHLTADVTTVSGCASAANGAIAISIEGGLAPFTFNWTNNATTKDINNLATGNYTLQVTDDNGCTASISVYIPVDSNSVLLANVNTISAASCSSAADGGVTVDVSGGTQPYVYNWNNGATTKDLNNVVPGTYQLTVTDNSGCVIQMNVTIGTDTVNGLQVKLDDVRAVTCADSLSGAIDVIVTGGAAPYIFSWSNGSSTQNLQGVKAGTYTLVVIDDKGCSDTLTVTVAPAPELDVTATITDANCYGSNEGAIVAQVANGTAPYTYSWSVGGSSASINNLSAGSYTLSVTDSKGCQSSEVFVVNQPDSLLVLLTTLNDTCLTDAIDGAIDLEVSGGTLPYTYTWSTGATTQDLQFLSAGIYTVKITDDNGCVKNAGTELFSHPCDFDLDIYNVLTPNGDGANDSWVIKGLQFYPNNEVRVFDKWGDEVFFQKGYKGNWNGTRGMGGEPLPDGTYFYVLRLNQANSQGGKNEFSGSLLIKR